jgi:deoxyadenosine/deoxycytidine kinase
MDDAHIPFLVYVSGNIGTGKSTMLNLAGGEQGWEAIPEGDDAFLMDAVSRAPSKFHSQMVFLARRLQQQAQIGKCRVALIERSLDEDRLVFWEYYRKRGEISDLELEILCYFSNTLYPYLRAPNFIVHLIAPKDVLSRRIRDRGREFERDLDLDLLGYLEERYLEWIGGETEYQYRTITTDRDIRSVWTELKTAVARAAGAQGL